MSTVLPTPAPPNSPLLPPLFEWRENVDGLNSGDENFLGRSAPHQRNRCGVHRSPFAAFDGSQTVNRLSEDVEHAPQHSLAHRDFQGLVRIDDGGPAREAPRGIQRDTANRMGIEMGKHFDDNVIPAAGAQDVEERRYSVVELRVHDAATHGFDRALVRLHMTK